MLRVSLASHPILFIDKISDFHAVNVSQFHTAVISLTCILFAEASQAYVVIAILSLVPQVNASQSPSVMPQKDAAIFFAAAGVVQYISTLVREVKSLGTAQEVRHHRVRPSARTTAGISSFAQIL